MAHTCTNCGATFTNERFCPTCGAWVDPLESGEASDEEFVLGETPPEDAAWEPPMVTAAQQTTACPSCGAANPAANRHCEECGARLSRQQLPVAPQPPVGTSAGLRAVIAVSAVLIVVFVGAAIFNALQGGPSTASTETTVAADASDTTAGQTKLRRINPIGVDCSSTAEGFSCDSLIARRSEQGWNNDPNSDEPIEFVFTFAPEVALEQVVLKNATDEERYTRNLKVQGFVIETDDMGGAVETNVIPEASGPHVINVATVGTTELTFRVTSTYPGEALDANRGPYDTLLIMGFEFYGRPAGE
jgi:ribosomal protein L32